MTVPKDEDDDEELATAAIPTPLLDASLSEIPKLNSNEDTFMYPKNISWIFSSSADIAINSISYTIKHFIPSSTR